MNNETTHIDEYVTMPTAGHDEVAAIATRVFTRFPGLLWSDEVRAAVALWARCLDGALVTLRVSGWQTVLCALAQVQFTEAQGGVNDDELAKVDTLRRLIFERLP